MIREKLIDEIIENTMGTCQSLEEHLEYFDMEIDDLSMEELGYIDDSIFNCDCCGWWYDLGEISDCEHSTVCMECDHEISGERKSNEF